MTDLTPGDQSGILFPAVGIATPALDSEGPPGIEGSGTSVSESRLVGVGTPPDTLISGGFFVPTDLRNPEYRHQVLKKTNSHCAYCGVDLPSVYRFHVDHMVPRTQGGGDEIGNLIAACSHCNISKGGRTIEEHRERLFSREMGWPLFREDQKSWLLERGVNIKEYILERNTVEFFIDAK